jgi:hypothetical protein
MASNPQNRGRYTIVCLCHLQVSPSLLFLEVEIECRRPSEPPISLGRRGDAQSSTGRYEVWAFGRCNVTRRCKNQVEEQVQHGTLKHSGLAAIADSANR